MEFIISDEVNSDVTKLENNKRDSIRGQQINKPVFMSRDERERKMKEELIKKLEEEKLKEKKIKENKMQFLNKSKIICKIESAKGRDRDRSRSRSRKRSRSRGRSNSRSDSRDDRNRKHRKRHSKSSSSEKIHKETTNKASSNVEPLNYIKHEEIDAIKVFIVNI
jgi:hypothetical protein